MKYPWLPALVLSAAVCAFAGAQPNRSTIAPEGTEAFRAILQRMKLEPVRKLADLRRLKPEETLLVVFGEDTILEAISNAVDTLGRFSKRGGAVLVATDHETGELYGWRVNGSAVKDQRQPYRRLFESCPRILNGLKKPHPLYEGMSSGIVTNGPSFLVRQRESTPLEPLATFPETAWVPGKERRELPFMAGSKDGDSARVLLVAGHGIFMNMLLAQDDNDNMTFAFNCVRWLSQAPGGGKRKHVFFVEDGTVAGAFDSGLTGPPRLPLPPARVLSRMIRGLEEEDFFNQLLRTVFHRNEILRAVLAFCSLGLLLYGGWRLLGARPRSEAAVPLPGVSVTATGDQPLLTQRRNAMKANGNFTEAAAGLVRSFFAEFAPAALIKPLAHKSRIPPFQANGMWLRRRLLMQQVSYLWRIALAEGGAVSARDLKRLPAVLDRVALALQQGRLIVNSEG
jgi:hypothetical protein